MTDRADNTAHGVNPEVQQGEIRQLTSRDFTNILFVHKWTILGSFILMLSLILWALSLRDVLVVGGVKFYVDRETSKHISIRYTSGMGWEEEINSIAELGRSPGVVYDAAVNYQKLRGWDDPPESVIKDVAAFFAMSVSVSPVPETDVISIMASDADADTAMIMAEVYAESFQREYTRVNSEGLNSAYFTNRIRKIEDSIRDASDRKAELQEASELIDWEHDGIALLERANYLERALAEERVALQTLEAQVAQQKLALASPSRHIASRLLREDPVVKRYDGRIADLEMQIASLESKYTSDHPEVKAVHEELEVVLDGRLAAMQRTHEEYVMVLIDKRKTVEAFIEEIDGIETRLMGIPANSVHLQYFDSYLDSQWRLYQEVVGKFNDKLVDEELKLLSSLLVQLGPATVMDVRGYTPPVVFWFVAPMFALVVAIAIAFLVEGSTHSFQRPDEIERFSNLPVLATFRKL